MRISTVQQMRAMDREAVTKYSIPELLLMENAAQAVIHFLQSKTALPGLRILLVCGPGNNGGDGFAIARLLHSEQCRVTVVIAADPSKYQGSALVNYQILQKLDLQCLIAHEGMNYPALFSEMDLIIDAMFGTGLIRPPQGMHAGIIRAVNGSGKPVLSVDIPSGIQGDSGQVLDPAVRAAWTVTFGLPKTGLLLYPGYDYAGELAVSHISFPPAIYENPEIRCQVNSPLELPPRRPDGHKGTFGQALFIAGARNYYGAPYFAAESFLKAGGGYARLACPRSMAPFIAAKGSEIVFLPQEETSDGSLSRQNLSRLVGQAGTSDIVILGPGISLQPETQDLARDLITGIGKPLVIDGDGLTALSGHLSLLHNRSEPTILTPHPGEMSRLLEGETAAMETDPIQTVRDFSRKWNVYLVLKGAHTLIAHPDGQVYINLTGNSGMGTAGSGDVLTGTIAAMFGLGLPIQDFVRMGVLVHGFAGDLAADQMGQDGITASDILMFLPEAVKRLRKQRFLELYPMKSQIFKNLPKQALDNKE